MRRIERLDQIGHLVAPVRMTGVIHGHAEDLPRRRQELAVKGIADPSRAVNRGMFRRVDEDREDGFGRGLDGDAGTDRFARHGYYLLCHGLETEYEILTGEGPSDEIEADDLPLGPEYISQPQGRLCEGLAGRRKVGQGEGRQIVNDRRGHA